jgi:thiamine-phosphate pyrophosphorylase
MIVAITQGGPRLPENIRAALDAGADRVLVREATLPEGLDAVALAYPSRIVLHTRMPGALALAASLPVGVHFASTVPAEAWRAAGAAPFSVSTHTVDEARAARAAGAAWVLLSPIWRSPSKPGDTRPPLGVGVLGAVDGAVALGGVDAARVGACRAAGAAGVAGMGGLFGAPNVGAAVSAWRAAWRGRDQKV